MNKWIKILASIVTVVLAIIFGTWYFLENRTVSDNLQRQNYITVQPDYPSDRSMSFALKERSFFSIYLSGAIKNGKNYYGYKHVTNDGDEQFKISKRYLLFYPLIATKTTQKEIRQKNFKVKQKVKKKDQEIISGLTKRMQSDEILIEYNHDYLPIYLKMYDKRDKKWKKWAKYSYPYKNRQAYEKDLDYCIKVVMSGAFGED